MNRQAFTLLEIAIAACLLAVFIFISIQLFSMASSYANFGIFRLSQQSQLRTALDWLKKDVRESGSDISLKDGNQTLLIRKFAAEKDGRISYGPDGIPLAGETCEYSFVRPANAGKGILYRNGHAILAEIDNVAFACITEAINDVQMLRVTITVEHQQQNGKRSKTSLHISPRHLASWARDPFWVSTESDQRFKYTPESSK